MDSTEAIQRSLVVKIAEQYVGTSYHPHGRVKGAGVDCLTLLCCVYEDAKLVPHIKLPHYAPDFFKHKGTELYLRGLLNYTHEITTQPLPGDIILWRYGRCFSHAAIVTKWPHIIHAFVGRCVMKENLENATWLKYMGENANGRLTPRPTKYFSYWGKDGRHTGGLED